MGDVDRAARDRLTGLRDQAELRLAALERERAGIVEAARAANADDEHDPEGATLAFEREHAGALIAAARARLAGIDAALARLADRSYGRCARCGEMIGAARLRARPDADACLACATGRRGLRRRSRAGTVALPRAGATLTGGLIGSPMSSRRGRRYTWQWRAPSPPGTKGANMDYKLGLVVVPVTDVDRAKKFYLENAGFRLDVDFSAGDFRVVQLCPPGSACAIALMRNPEAAGTLQGLHLMVTDINAAREDMTGRGVEISEVYHFEGPERVPGPDPSGRDYGNFMSFSDPDGTGWLVQEARDGDRVAGHDEPGA